MNTRFDRARRKIWLVALSLAVLGSVPATFAEPQRGSKGSSAGASRGSGGGSVSRPSSSQGSRGSSMGSRPSSVGSRGSSVGSRGSSVGSRPSVSPRPSSSSGGSIRPSSPSVRPSSSPEVRSAYPSGTSRPSSVSPGSRPSSSPSSAPTGRDTYGGRSIQPDSAPSAGPASELPGAGSSFGSRPSPRVRFPAAYSPAGSTSRGSSFDSRGAGAVAPRPSTSGVDSGKSAPGKRGESIVRYDSGPTRRVDKTGALDTRAIAPKEVTVPSTSKGASVQGARPDGSAVKSPAGGAAKSPKATPSRAKGVKDIQQKDFRGKGAKSSGKGVVADVLADPKASKEVFVATKVAGKASKLATGVAVGAIGGGVQPGDFYGGGVNNGGGDCDWVDDPCGWNGWSSCGWSFSWCWWSYPCYWGWYYPVWWWCSQPYYYYDYAYYAPIASVYYVEPEVVYVERPATERYAEPVGEAVAPAEPAGAIAPPAPAQSPLSIAAQRYLELGDRAFREARYTDAVQFYAKAVEFAPDQGALYLVLADALFAAGDYHYGAYAVRRALELDPALVESQVDKHSFYPDPAQFDAQLDQLERYVAEHATDRDARLVLGLNYLFGGRPLDAERTLSGGSMNDDAAAQKILARARALSQR